MSAVSMSASRVVEGLGPSCLNRATWRGQASPVCLGHLPQARAGRPLLPSAPGELASAYLCPPRCQTDGARSDLRKLRPGYRNLDACFSQMWWRPSWMACSLPPRCKPCGRRSRFPSCPPTAQKRSW